MEVETQQTSKHKTIKNSIENVDADMRLLQFIQILMRINDREKLVKYDKSNNRNTNNTD